MKKPIIAILIALVAAGCEVKAQIDTNYIRVISSRYHSTQMIYRDTLPYTYTINDGYTLRTYTPRPNDTLDTMYVYNHLRYVLYEIVSPQMDAAYGCNILYWKGVYDGMQLILNRPYDNLEDVFYIKMRTNIDNH